jgi:4-amino-4-deoxy-L-arabinose transferase-like glycosyltransferase
VSRRTVARSPAKRPPVEKAAVGGRSFTRRSQTARGWPGGRRPATGSSLNRWAEALASVPRVAWICVAVACVNAVCWSLISPPFQIPDEPSHFAYIEHLATTGTLPTSSEEVFSPAEREVLIALKYLEIRAQPQNRTIATAAEQADLEQVLHTPASNESEDAGVATEQPPLYYALETIPYNLGGTILVRLALMRLLSALMAGVTALFAFLFLREALPGVRWAWTVGGLGVALFPLLGFMSGAVNPDAMLYAVSAALFFVFARAFRLGLTPGRAGAIGAVVAIGVLTKLNFIGFLPGAALALAVLARRAARVSRPQAYRSLASAIGVAAAPLSLYLVLNALSGHPSVLDVHLAGNEFIAAKGSIFAKLSYLWELYLPALPGMPVYFHGVSTTRQLWFDGLVGRYGWLDTFFPAWVYNLALIPAALIAGLCVRELARNHGALAARAAELVVYCVMAAGVMVLVAASDYLTYPEDIGAYIEPRYLMPMVVLFGAILALAARGAGRRWGPAVGTLLVLVILGHDIFSQLLVISRYYA